jgi:hypothetical protein
MFIMNILLFVCVGSKSYILRRSLHPSEGSPTPQVRDQTAYAVTGKNKCRGEGIFVCSGSVVVG